MKSCGKQPQGGWNEAALKKDPLPAFFGHSGASKVEKNIKLFRKVKNDIKRLFFLPPEKSNCVKCSVIDSMIQHDAKEK